MFSAPAQTIPSVPNGLPIVFVGRHTNINVPSAGGVRYVHATGASRRVCGALSNWSRIWSKGRMFGAYGKAMEDLR